MPGPQLPTQRRCALYQRCAKPAFSESRMPAYQCNVRVNGPRAEPMQPLHGSASGGVLIGCEAGQSSHTEHV